MTSLDVSGRTTFNSIFWLEITAVDYLEYEGAKDRFGVVYVLVNTKTGERLVLKTSRQRP